MPYAIAKGKCVSHNGGGCQCVFRYRGTAEEPTYLIRHCMTGTVTDQVPESELAELDCVDVINNCWMMFTYTGDNGAASQWVLKLIKDLDHVCGAASWGPNEDNTVYTLTLAGVQTWNKNKV
jgi:hypothetical protein